MFATLTHAFAHQIETRPDAIALIVGFGSESRCFTWQQLAERVCLQSELLEHHFDSETEVKCCVGYASNNSLNDVLTALACPLISAMEIPVDHRHGVQAKKQASSIGGIWLNEQDLTQQRDSLTKAPLERIQGAMDDIPPDAPALLLWTSGTTTVPKAVMLTHRNLIANAQAKIGAVPNTAQDVRLTSLPICHAYARTCDLGTWLISGCTLALGLGFESWQTMAPEIRPTIANVVPSLSMRLLESDPASVGIDRLGLLGCGGAAMSEQNFQAWKDRGVTVIQGYGLTESSPVICSATPENAKPGLVGKFVDGWEYEIRNGRLFVRGPHVMAGYWNDVSATDEKIVDGWLDTGDVVEIDSSTQQLRILGRADDVIVLTNGRKVHPQSIERQIECLERVRHAMIVGAGRSVEVWLDADDSTERKKDIQRLLADRPSWERPTAVHYFDRRLSAESGELTNKGTIRRERAAALIRQAGS